MSSQLINKLKSYNAIGFDLDHTLAKYKIDAIFPVIYEAITTKLIEKFGWSQLTDHLNSGNYKKHSSLWKMQKKGIVYDKEFGTLLQLNKNAQVVHALKGRTTLSQKEIETYYPDDRKPKFATEIITKFYNGKDYRLFENFFDILCVPLLSEMVAITDELDIKDRKSYSQIWDDLLFTLYSVYDNTKSIVGHPGGFFHLIESDPGKYVETVPDQLKALFRELREKHGVFIFLMTASNHDYASHLMRYIWSGTTNKSDEWLKDFDLALYLAWKPDFFSRNCAFEAVDSERAVDELKRFGQFSRGNYSILQKFLIEQCGVKSPRVAYFGDSCKGDVFPLKLLPSWDSWSIVEELSTESRPKSSDEIDCTDEKALSIWHIPVVKSDTENHRNGNTDEFYGKRSRLDKEDHTENDVNDCCFDSTFFCEEKEETLWYHNILSCSTAILQQLTDLIQEG